MTTTKTLIFDFDGVLVDSMVATLHVLNRALKPGTVEITRKDVIGRGAQPLGEFAEERTTLDQVEFYARLAVADLKLTRFYPGVREALRELRADGYHLTIATNRAYEHTKALLSELRAFDFTVVSTWAPGCKPKPDPKIVRAAALTKHALVIGDTPHDQGAAKAAGFEYLHAAYGYGWDDAVTTPMVDRPQDLLQAINAYLWSE